ncbi:MAG TPA: NADH-ubiquinone oxidoreductase-F iron-sulfur binding region domain-containing protein [Acidimicrobiia bacterium]|jgi:NADH:ubiquinone oxidoreductase subunit F (NADH-binding)|nr:NADH-ubiquinone oxidoreductase-F iron-sulfur binding region domain-containing protein [Acidimicrobiia bacterium]
MATITRVLDPGPVPDFDAYVAGGGGGGQGLEAARKLGPSATIEEIEASGLRGRGGAGFPTGRKWAAVANNRAPGLRPSVVVNASEGEPGSFKDRTLLRRNPYRIIEGAIIAAEAVDAERIVFALKASFGPELERLKAAINEVTQAGWTDVTLLVVEGPAEYLYGEETALLEVIDGREPFPRIAPPYRHGVDDVGRDPVSAAGSVMASPGGQTAAAPALVNNAETLANVPGILAEGAAWFRQAGTADSPGTVVCTVSGGGRRAGVAEFEMGTSLAEVIETIGGPGPRVQAVLSGVANPLLPGDLLDTPVSYEGMEAAGTGLGAAGFLVFAQGEDLAAVVAGVSRFLAVESCGQCTPCKQDGLAIADILARVARNEPEAGDADELDSRVTTVADEARCALAGQQQRVVGSLLSLFPDAVRDHLGDAGAPSEPVLVASLVDIDDGRAVVDEHHRDKQPDWTFDEVSSGQSPADRLDQRLEEATTG